MKSYDYQCTVPLPTLEEEIGMQCLNAHHCRTSLNSTRRITDSGLLLTFVLLSSERLDWIELRVGDNLKFLFCDGGERVAAVN